MVNINLPQPVKNTLTTLKEKGFQVYIVGGAVRNYLLGKLSTNWDFATNAKPEEIMKLFSDSYYDNQFGTVGVPQLDGQIYEITTFRSEFGYSDRRRPDKVIWGNTIEEDLSRRDFTINSIAFDGLRIIDPFGGKDDMQKKVIRAVGDPNQRFNEDALRLLRAIRIATQLGFTIEEKTFKAISKNAQLIKSVSGERIRDEFLKILSSDYPADGIMLLKNSLLLKVVLPELDQSFNVPQKSPKRHHVHDVGTHLVLSLKHCQSDDPIVRLATLLHDIGKPEVFVKGADEVITFYNHEVVGARIGREISNRWHLSNKTQDKLVTLIRWHQFTVSEYQTDKAFRRFIRRVGKENINDMLFLREADRLGGGASQTSWRLELFKERLEKVQEHVFSVSDLKVDGFDVMKVLKIKSGPFVGQVLAKLFEEVDEEISKNSREHLLGRIKSVCDELLLKKKEEESR